MKSQLTRLTRAPMHGLLSGLLVAVTTTGCVQELADQDDVGSEVMVIQDAEEIVNEPAVVRIKRDGRASCSGVLLTNHAVLTARHCIAASLDAVCGDLLDPSRVTVSQLGGTSSTGERDQVNVRRMEAPDSDSPCTDLALLRLDSPLSFTDYSNGRQESRQGRSSKLAPPALELERLVGVELTWIGTGHVDCSSAWPPTAARLARSTVDGIERDNHELEGGHLLAPFLWFARSPGGPQPLSSDSGGPSFYRFFQPGGDPIVGVHTGRKVGVPCHGAENAYVTPIHSHRHWIATTVGDWSRNEQRTFSRRSGLNNFERWNHGDTRGTPSWTVSNGELREDSNAYTSDAGFTWGPTLIDEDQALFNGMVEVDTRRTADNDVQGLVQRARNENNYYQFAAREQGGWARIDRRSGYGDRRLAEVRIRIDWWSSHHLKFVAVGDSLYGFIDGEFVVAARDATFNAHTSGSVGLMEHGQEGARFDNFRITHPRITP